MICIYSIHLLKRVSKIGPKCTTPTPGIEPGLPARQASVIAIRPRRRDIEILTLFHF